MPPLRSQYCSAKFLRCEKCLQGIALTRREIVRDQSKAYASPRKRSLAIMSQRWRALSVLKLQSIGGSFENTNSPDTHWGWAPRDRHVGAQRLLTAQAATNPNSTPIMR
jgi:hypothetical protein